MVWTDEVPKAPQQAQGRNEGREGGREFLLPFPSFLFLFLVSRAGEREGGEERGWEGKGKGKL